MSILPNARAAAISYAMWRKIRIVIIGANFTVVLHASIWVADDLLAPELGPISESQVELMQQADTGEPSWPGWRRDHAVIVFSPYSDT